MKKIIFLLIFTTFLTSCSVDLNWEKDEKIIESINKIKLAPSCTNAFNDTTVVCVWPEWTCKSLHLNEWQDCWNALD